MREVEEGVHVRQKAIANVHGRSRRFRNAGPDVSFLRESGEGVVVAVKGEEGAELHPAVAELLVRVAVEAAGVGAEHGDAKEREAKGLRDGEEHVGPEAGVVAAPVAGPFAGAEEGGAPDDEGSLSWYGGKQGVVGCVENLVAEQIVHVVLLCAIRMSCVW